MLNLNDITINQRQQRPDKEVLRNAQRFIPAKRLYASQEDIMQNKQNNYKNYKIKQIRKSRANAVLMSGENHSKTVDCF